MYVLYDGGANTNRAYLGTDTRSQCLFIGCALAVGLVLLTQRSHEDGRLAKGELWRPAGATGRALCGAIGVVGAVAAVTIWVLTTSTSPFPYSGGFFLIGLAVAGVILSAVAAPRSIVPRLLSLTPVRYVGRISYGLYIWHWPIFIWLDNARTGLLGYELFAVRVRRHVRRLGGVLPPGRASHPHGDLRPAVEGLGGGSRRRRRGAGRGGGRHIGHHGRGQHAPTRPASAPRAARPPRRRHRAPRRRRSRCACCCSAIRWH